MDNSRKIFLEKLTDQYKQAAKNSNVSRTQTRALYFELNCLRKEIEAMSEDEFALVNEEYNKETMQDV